MKDHADSAERAEPIDPIEPKDPADPIDSTDPTDPIDRIEQVDPMDRIEPFELRDFMHPVDHATNPLARVKAMRIEKLHVDEVDIDLAMARALLADQYPPAAEMAISEVIPAGTSNVMLRLGDGLVMRLPRNQDAASSLEKEWLYPPLFSAHVPVAISVPEVVGRPGHRYPFAWTISKWLPGERPTPVEGEGLQLGRDLANFVVALHAATIPSEIALESYRGGPIGSVDSSVRSSIAACEGLLDVGRLTEAWNIAQRVPEGDGARVWLHTDLQPGNILVEHGRLSAVVDWGGLAIGDPSVDLIVAWNLLSPESREVFRATVAVTDETWSRGRAWALAIGIIAYPYYVESNPALSAISKKQIEQVIADVAI